MAKLVCDICSEVSGCTEKTYRGVSVFLCDTCNVENCVIKNIAPLSKDKLHRCPACVHNFSA